MTTCALSDVPDTYKKSGEIMSRFLQGRADSTVWLAYLKGRPALMAIAPDRIYLAAGGGFGGIERGVLYKNIARLNSGRRSVELASTNGESYSIDFPEEGAAHQFFEAASRARQDGLVQATEQALAAEAAGGPSAPVISKILIVTTNDVPGHEIIAVHGDVFGLTVRARNMFANFGASLKGVVGGEVKGYTTLLTSSRNEARERLAAEALAKGANAVVAMRFDCNEIADIMSEVAAYGTAVTIRPIASASQL
jgi:uncharacterized protein YbjQ (UPF0145 family)